MKQRLSKSEIKKQIDDFFIDVKNKNPKQMKKIKNLAMTKNIQLKENRKTFCKYCLNPYRNPKIRIKNKVKNITCGKCGKVSRWKIK
jgi:RNase P subunit RPR2